MSETFTCLLCELVVTDLSKTVLMSRGAWWAYIHNSCYKDNKRSPKLKHWKINKPKERDQLPLFD